MLEKILHVVTRGFKLLIMLWMIWQLADFLSTLMIRPAPPGMKVGILFLPVALLLLLNKPELSYMTLLFTRPLVEPLWQFRLMNTSVLGLFSFAYIILVVYMVTRSREFKCIPGRIKYFYWFFLISSLSLVNTTNLSLSITVTVKYLAILSLFLLGYNFARSFENVFKLIRLIVYSSIIPIIYGIYQHIVGAGVQKYKSFQVMAGVARINSVFSLSNGFAYYLGLIIILVVFILYHSKIKNEKMFCWLIIAGSLFCLANTHVRTVWVAFFLSMCIIAFYDKNSRKFIILVCLIALPLSYNIIVDRFSDILVQPEYGTSSLEFRSGITRELLINAVPKHLFIGFGTGDAMAASSAYTRYNTIPHNDFMRVLVENGILGLIAYLLVLGNIFIFLFNLVRKKINIQSNLIFFTVLIYYIINTTGQNVFGQISTSGYIFCLMGMAVKLDEIRMESDKIANEK